MNSSTGTSSEWMQFYEQSMDEMSASSSLGFSDVDATIVASSESNQLNLSSGRDDQLAKGSSPKPIRRRARASKKTPTTLLNADASNFRALVQRFTGCPTTPPLSTNNRRGPINLNFALGSDQNQSGTASSVMPAAANDYYYPPSHQQHHAAFNRDVPYTNENANDGNYFLQGNRNYNFFTLIFEGYEQ
ncbi:hypothetical protein ES332_A12G051900v1 [Gossypium tomentosum]|nr:hypothetical protein ES332_A12G051900v1 [Gossypium tomentosum]